jgi:hypothetical protein
VTLDRSGYQLDYRRGYYADNSNSTQAQAAKPGPGDDLLSPFLGPGRSVKPRDKAVILSEAPHRSIANRGFMARSRRTPAVLVGRCFWELSDCKLQRKIKSHKLRE